MKRINWHNPTIETPPEGYRLLIPEEVVGGARIKGALGLTIFGKWAVMVGDTNKLDRTYAAPKSTPLPEGYAVIDGEPWQMDGWTLHTPGDMVHINSHIPSGQMMEVCYRSGIRCRGFQRQHYFGEVVEPIAEIIGWRLIQEEEAPESKPMTATDIMEADYPKDHAADRAWAVTQQMSQQLEDFRTVLAENQRLRNELADAQATLRTIRSLLP